MRIDTRHMTLARISALCAILVLPLLFSNLFASDYVAVKEKHSSSANHSRSLSDKSTEADTESVSGSETYSLAPTIQDDQYYYFLSDQNRAVTLTFNQEWKSLGGNAYGTDGGRVLVFDEVEDLENGNVRFTVQVTAVDANSQPEPWVDASFADSGFITWRLDIGIDAGGSDQISPDGDFQVVDSGVWLYDSAGEFLVGLEIEDTSDTDGLSGLALVGLNGESIAGDDLATMIMYWDVKIESDSPDTGYKVTTGLTGAWFDPSHNGEGYILQIQNENQAVVFWFTYDQEGKQFWMLGVGEIDGSKIFFEELMYTKGGKFGPEFDPDDVERIPWGTLELNFSDCNNALASYSGPDGFGSGTLNVQRITSVWGLDCSGDSENVSTTGEGFLSPGFSGAWFDISHNGEGFTFEVLDEKRVLLYWFTYDTEGNQAWMMMPASIDGATVFASDVYQPMGPKFGPEFDPDDLHLREWGAAVFSFGTCTDRGHGGSMRYLPPPDFGPESRQLLYRLTTIGGTDCRFLSGTYDVSGAATVAENIVVDGDVNDPNVEEVPNDPGDGLPEQQLFPPARVAGFVTATPTEVEGERFELEADEWDTFILPMKEGEGLTLTLSDWDPGDKDAVDLDLYLVDVNDSENVVDSSLGIEEQETVLAPYTGNFFVFVNAVAGKSNYLLESGQLNLQNTSQIDITTPFVSSQVLASVKSPQWLEMNSDGNVTSHDVQILEKSLGLRRLEESPSGAVIYETDNANISLLPPHPLSLVGFGDFSPIDWRVVTVAKRLAAEPDFNWAGPNYILEHNAVPNDEYFKYQWHYELVRLPEAWDIERGSENVVVAVVDSGVYNHPDLSSNVDYSLGYDFVSSIFDSGDGDGIDSDATDPGESYPSFQPYVSHGTHVAGTVGARTNNNVGVAGTAWNVSIMPVRVMGVSGGGTCSDIHEGIRWAGRLSNKSGYLPRKQADIVNLSLGGWSPCPGMQDTINQLTSNGVIVIAAAGNEGISVPMYPASFANVISVSATTVADNLAGYSNYGNSVDIAAPGGDNDTDLNNDSLPDGVLSNFMYVEQGSSLRQTDYWFLPGTSMAAPHVAGIAALMKSVFPNLNHSQFNTALASGAITLDLADNGDAVKDQRYGYGRIDALKAVQWAVKAEQGQETNAFMTSNLSATNFSSDLLNSDLVVAKAGSGGLNISNIGWTEEWISVSSVNVNNDGFGRYRISVNRGSLAEGQYSGWVAFEANNGSQLWISVLMRVGEALPGRAEYIYTLVLDQWTLGNVKSWDGPQIDDAISFELQDQPPGIYYIVVSTDLDRDYTVCDDGELCEIYPSNSEVARVLIQNKDVELGTFRIGFPSLKLKTESINSSPVNNSFMQGQSQQGSAINITAELPREE